MSHPAQRTPGEAPNTQKSFSSFSFTQLIATLEAGRAADFSGGVGYLKLSKPLEEMLLLGLFLLTRLEVGGYLLWD